ncbi:DUF3301 domain-containing protein [Sideroxydans lithotrophicus]|uniref:DUF3301 domain-containing protein n=1 Tax=Sideroxydans lithotrophicus TaxID=63745 RepID=UPI001CBEE125|nr:DUF3301 domain-containing protein [Sideroxydans lithotrophicus]
MFTFRGWLDQEHNRNIGHEGVYRFEFSETGDSRQEGKVVMLGERVERVAMEPYQVVE